VLDSVSIYQLVGFMENEFGIEVDDDDLLPDNFSTISAIERLVKAKRG
jgi:acyl carrier protein